MRTHKGLRLVIQCLGVIQEMARGERAYRTADMIGLLMSSLDNLMRREQDDQQGREEAEL